MTTRRAFLASSLTSATAAVLPWRSFARSSPTFSTDPFSLGVASGYPTADSVVLWTRLAPRPLDPDGGMPPSEISVRWEVATDDKMRKVVRAGTQRATSEWAHSVHVEVEGLEPARDYWYRFTAGDVRSGIARTRTVPAAGHELARLRVAVASCQQYEQGYFSAYRHMLEDELDLIVHVGDYIYELTWGRNLVRSHGSPEAYSLADYRARYALYKSDPDLAAAHAAYPWLVMWDDHEVENDYAGDVSEDNIDPKIFLARRAAAYRAYYEHMPLPRSALPHGPGMRLYDKRTFGDLASIYTLDQRQYRSREACPRPGRAGSNRVSDCAELEDRSRTMLGKEQESWLDRGFADARAQARWNLLAQGTVMAHLDEQPGPGRVYWTDAWNGYPAARAKLMDDLSERRVSNPVVLSGDIHAFLVSGLHRVAADLDSPLVGCELVASSITSQAAGQKTFDVLRAENPNILVADSTHRGYLRLDLRHERLAADLIAIDTPTDPRSARHTLRSFVIEDGRPEPQPA